MARKIKKLSGITKEATFTKVWNFRKVQHNSSLSRS